MWGSEEDGAGVVKVGAVNTKTTGVLLGRKWRGRGFSRPSLGGEASAFLLRCKPGPGTGNGHCRLTRTSWRVLCPALVTLSWELSVCHPLRLAQPTLA